MKHSIKQTSFIEIILSDLTKALKEFKELYYFEPTIINMSPVVYKLFSEYMETRVRSNELTKGIITDSPFLASYDGLLVQMNIDEDYISVENCRKYNLT